MTHSIDNFHPLVGTFRSWRSRATSLLAAAAVVLGAAPAIAQQDAPPVIPLSGFHNFELRVTDVERSLAFYQGLFGAPVISRTGDSVSLLVGDGPQYFTLAPTRTNEQPGISHFGLSVPGFDLFGLQRQLAEHGLDRTVETMFDGRSRLSRANHTWTVRLRDETEEMMSENHHLFFADRDGTIVQLSSLGSCGAGEGRSAVCNLEPAPAAGLMQLREINHFTTFVANYQLTNDFYRGLFGLADQAFQGQFPLLGLGDGKQFLMFVGGVQPGTPNQPGRIDHASLNIDDFTEESVLQRLTDYGLTPRPDGEPAAPLQHWVSRRMPERGGAPGGTPEVYFSDPDGIHIQLQHLSYCGGGGVFGEDC